MASLVAFAVILIEGLRIIVRGIITVKQVGYFNHRVVILVADKLGTVTVVMRGLLWY